MNDKNKIKVKDEKGNEVVCDILFTFENDETNKNYIVYTDNSKNDKGELQIYASTYVMDGEKMKLEDVKTDKEWNVIDTILKTIQEEVGKKGE